MPVNTQRREIRAADARALGTTASRLRRALRRGIRLDLRWEDLPMAHVELLQCLADQPGLKVGQVARTLRLAPNTISTLVAQLSANGLLETDTDQTDRRARLLRPSAAGYSQLSRWQAAHERMLGAAVQQLTAADRDALLAALPAFESLIDILDRES